MEKENKQMKDKRMHSRAGDGNIFDFPVHPHKADLEEGFINNWLNLLNSYAANSTYCAGSKSTVN